VNEAGIRGENSRSLGPLTPSPIFIGDGAPDVRDLGMTWRGEVEGRGRQDSAINPRRPLERDEFFESLRVFLA